MSGVRIPDGSPKSTPRNKYVARRFLYLSNVIQRAEFGEGEDRFAGSQVNIFAYHFKACMPENALQRVHITTVFEIPGCEGVPLRYNYDKPENPRISRVFGYLARFFILFQTEKSSREVVIS